MVSETPPAGHNTPAIRVQPASEASRDSWEEDRYSSDDDQDATNPYRSFAPEHQQGPAGASAFPVRDDVPAALKPGGGFTIPAAAPATYGSAASIDNIHANVWSEPAHHPSASSTPAPPAPTPPSAQAQVPVALQPGVVRKDTNPFHRKPVGQSSQPPHPPPSEEMLAKLSLHEPAKPSENTVTASVFDDIKQDPWNIAPPPPSQVPRQPTSVGSPNLISFAPEDEPGWERASSEAAPVRPSPPVSDWGKEQPVWDDLGLSERGAKGAVLEVDAGQAARLDDWNLVDAEPSSRGSPSITPLRDDDASPPPLPDKERPKPPAAEETKPELPPRTLGESSRWVPTRQAVDGSTETYQIKNIQWHDLSAAKNPRVSPILVQNANGPCPLVALVNALTMTTPAEQPDVALVQVLRSREQVSLNLLLDAVFDELMSSRRTGSGDALPDVSDLYAFLLSLHTGMNVNPRFIPTTQVVNAYKRTSLTHLHPAERADLVPGTFENTHEMGLYATFSIPLIHGWLPAPSDPVYEALGRQAASYEDVQNLLFREEELEDRLVNSESGLSENEQQLYQDIITIKSFLSTSATQLTPWGIEVIGKAIRPGTFAILFRNDHFSTLYCHPETKQLLTLVTDAGYRSHEDVVWESLVDVNGERTEFFSGNFKAVDYSESGATGASRGGGNLGSDGGGEWATAQAGSTRRNQHQASQQGDRDSSAAISSREQEDRDLALALQLQEEEDQRHREAETRRQQESRLSEQYIEQQARQPVPSISGRGSVTGLRGASSSGAMSSRGGGRGGHDLVPGRRSSSNVAGSATGGGGGGPVQEVRPLVPPRRPTATTNRPDVGGDDAPPSYEQASRSPAFVPPRGHPSHAGSISAASSSSQPTANARPGQSATGRRVPGQTGAGPGGGATGGHSRDRERDCVVM